MNLNKNDLWNFTCLFLGAWLIYKGWPFMGLICWIGASR